MASWGDVVKLIASMPGDGEARRGAHLRELASVRGATALVGEGLRTLHDVGGLETLGDLLDDPEVEALLHDNFDRNERRLFLRGLPGVILRWHQERPGAHAAPRPAPGAPDRAAPHGAHHRAPAATTTPDVDRVPVEAADLRSWGRHVGVAMDGEVVRVRVGQRIHTFSLLEMADVVGHPRLGAAQGVDRVELRRIAEEVLVSRARAAQAVAIGRAAFEARRQEPTDPVVRDFLATLRAAAKDSSEPGTTRLPGFEVAPPAPPFAYPVAQVTFSPASLQLGVEVPGVLLYPASIELDTGRVAVLGIHPEARPALHGAALAAGIDALCDPESAARRALEEWSSKPAWRHLLDRVEDDILRRGLPGAPSPPREARLAFRMDPESGLPVPLVQGAKRGGGFTVGRQAAVEEARDGVTLDPLDEEILDLLELLQIHGEDHPDGTPRRALLRMFDLLGRHPRVFLAGQGTAPVRVVRAPIRLVPVEVPGGHRLDVLLGDHPLGADVDLSPIATFAPPGGDLLLWSPLDRVSRAVIGALSEGHGGDAVLPAEAIEALFRTLEVHRHVALVLELPEALRGEPIDAAPRLVVTLSGRAGDTLAAAVRVRPWKGGPLLVPGQGAAVVYGTGPQGARVHAQRRPDEERAAAEKLLAALGPGLEVSHDLAIDVADPDHAGDVVVALAELGDAVEVGWEGPALRVARTATPSALRLRVERRRDWFGVDGGVEVDGERIGLAALLEAIRARRRFVRLKKGGLLAIGRELRERLARADDLLIADGAQLGVGPHGVERLADLVEEDAQIDAAREWLTLRARWREARAHEPVVPEGFGAALRPYQRAGFAWLARLAACGVGGCLADDMGLGKTVQALALLVSRAAEGPAIVVAPTSVCANWEAEAGRFAPGLRVIPHRGAGRAQRLPALGCGDLLVTSYDVLVRDVEALAATRFATVMFDEAHALKNAASKRAQAARQLEGDARIALTGTPVENRLGELWSLFRVVMPTLFGPWERFRERFATPIERDRDPARREALAELVRPYLLRRTKEEVAPELPPRTELVRFVDLSDDERELYEAERRASIEAFAGRRGDEDARFAIFSALLRLRQLACHPRLRHDDATVPSSKLASAVELLEEVRDGGHRALVFSQFTTHLALVGAALRDRGFSTMELDGSTPAAARAERVTAFQAGRADVFLISLKAGGVGLNLTAADYVLHLDPWWNPAAEDQASDRAHRIGQDRPVTIVRLITRGTIEETVLSLHEEKRALADAVLAGGDASASLSTAELVALMERGGSGAAPDGAPANASPAPARRRARAR